MVLPDSPAHFASLRYSSPMKDFGRHQKASESNKRPCAGRTRKSTERSNRQEANKMLVPKVVLDMHFRFFLGNSDIPREEKVNDQHVEERLSS
jgi:hypothetical protein